MKTKWTLAEIRDVLMGPFTIETESTVKMIMYIETMFYEQHLADIKARQDELQYLISDPYTGKFLSIWVGGKAREQAIYRDIFDVISPACKQCLDGSYIQIKNSTKCTQDCDYCFFKPKNCNMKVHPIGKGMYALEHLEMNYTLDELELMIAKQLGDIKSIGYVYLEPLEELTSLIKIMPKVRNRGLYQYLYTNGIRANKEVIDILADCGLNEMRFNLQATGFDHHVIERMAYAVEKFDFVCAEFPMYSKSYANLIKNKDLILQTGIQQINLGELQICSLDMLDKAVKEEGPVYKHRRGRVSPISSRHYACDILELAEKEDWPIIINDCSNDTKYYRAINRGKDNIGLVFGYYSLFELPFNHVYTLAEKVLEDGVTYEFF